VDQFPDNSLGFFSVSQTSGQSECVPQELSEHFPGFPQGSLTVLNTDFGFGYKKSVTFYVIVLAV